MMHINQQTLKKPLQQGILAIVLLGLPGICVADAGSAPLLAAMARCDDIKLFSFEAFSELKRSLVDDEQQQRARRAGVLANLNGQQNDLLWEFRFTHPLGLFDLHAVGVGNSFGALPGLVVAFDDPLTAVQGTYEGFGFKFQCNTVSELNGTACEASLNVEQPTKGSLSWTVMLIESSSMLQVGKSLAVCTVLPKEGNPFR